MKQLDTSITHCSCHTCRKANAAAFNTVVGIKPENFMWLKGEQELSSYESSSGKKRFFCKHCGSQVVAIKENHPYYVLRVATLDDDPGMILESRIWQSHEVTWLDYNADIPSFLEWSN